MTDAERLIELWAKYGTGMFGFDYPEVKDSLGEAATLIQQQSARIVELEGALRPFAEAKLQPEVFVPDLDIDGTHAALKITFGDLARARAVLGETSSAK